MHTNRKEGPQLTKNVGNPDTQRTVLEERDMRTANEKAVDLAAARSTRRLRRQTGAAEKPGSKRPVRRLLAILPATDYREVSG
jgi:hypothetical protein